MSHVALLDILGAAALKAGVILAIAGVATLTWRSASAAARHLVWTVAVTGSLAVPVFTIALSRMHAPRLEVDIWTPEALPLSTGAYAEARKVEPPPASSHLAEGRGKLSDIAARSPTESVVDNDPGLSVQAQGNALQPTAVINWRARLLELWLAGTMIALLPLLVGMVRVRALARGTRAARSDRWRRLITETTTIAHLADRVRIVESDRSTMPMTWGIFRPTLLIPSDTERWPDWQCRDILLHELAHVERRDCLTQFLAQITCALYWFNPLAWVASARMKVERELACDDRVIAAGSRASDYASNLLGVARSLRAPSLTSHTAIAMARPSQLSGRLLAVLDSRRNRRRVTGRMAAATSFGALALVLSLASLTTASPATAGTGPLPGYSGPTVVAPAAKNAPAASFSAVPLPIVRAVQLPEIQILSAAQSFQSAPAAPAREESAFPALNAQAEGCWDGTDGQTNVSVNNNDKRGGRSSYTVRYSRDNCSLELQAEGDFTLRPDLSDVETVGRDGWVRIEERIGRSSKRIEIRRADNGALEHTYWVNGDRATYDSSARAWLARTLLSVERRTAFAAGTRVPQLYRSSGLRGVLSEISQMPSAYPKSRYYETLLDMGVKLDTNTLNGIVKQVGTDLSSSDYYLSEVLGRFGAQGSADETTWRLFSETAGRMKSDYYKSQTLKKVLDRGRLGATTVATLLGSASGIKSDYYLTDLLKEVASRYALNAATRKYYVEALHGVESDYYRSELLKTLGNEGDWDSSTSAFVLEAAAGIKSDYYKSESLRALARGNHVANWASFFDAVGTIGSDYYKKETLTSALSQSPLTREIVAGVITAASRMKSDSEMAEVLSAAAGSYRIDASLRVTYEKAVDAMRSDYYRGAALSALRRSMART